MRRGEAILLVAFLIGVVLHLVPARDDRATAPTDAESIAAVATEPARQPSPSHGAIPSGAHSLTLDSYNFDQKTAIRWKLPAELKEISGLALTSRGRLLTHNDERGVIFEVDYSTGEVTKSFELADSRGRLDDDYEGIAVSEDRLYVLTAGGLLYETAEGDAGERVPCVIHDTGLGADYEFEGLAYEPRTRELLLTVKLPRRKAAEGGFYIFRWSTETKRLVEDGQIEIPVKEITSQTRGKTFNTSGMERHPLTGNYFLVAARQHTLVEITPDGTLVSVKELPADWHLQAEGIAFATDNSLILSDEGAGRRARLTIYPLLSQ